MTAPSLPAGGAPSPHADAGAGSPHRARTSGSRLARALWIAAGSAMLAAGIVGVVLPGWPTTIFVILALACYARSSQALYDRVAGNRLIGRQARAFRETGVMPRRAKAWALGLMWLFVGIAVLAGIPDGLAWAKLLTLVVAGAGTAYILRLPSAPR